MTKAELTAAVNARLTEQNTALAKLDDETALAVTALFPLWKTGKAYAVDERICYGNKLYRCVQAHTSLDSWYPPAVPALWTEVAQPGEIPVWRQPIVPQDAYAKGDKVRHNDKVWQSNTDNNVWEPGVYGWDEAE